MNFINNLDFEWLAMLFTGCGFILLLLIAQIIKEKTAIHTEYTRKLVHLSAGIFICCFPFIFEHFGSVLLLSIVFFILMLLSKRKNLLESLHGVDRESSGVFLYPLAVALVFYLSAGDWLYFMVPILLLSIPDAAAAIIGKEYGSITYAVNRQSRTLEGSAIFFLFSFLIVLIPLLLSNRFDNETVLLIALLLSLIITGIEAICVLGVDNLFIPLCSNVGLMQLISRTNQELLINVIVLFSIFLLMILINRWKRFTISGIIGMSLMLYITHSWGGVNWLIPAIWYFLTFNLGLNLTGFNPHNFNFLSYEKSKGLFEISAVFHIAIVPFLLLTINLSYPNSLYYNLYVISVGAAIVISYYHFLPYWLRKVKLDTFPPGSIKSGAFRLLVSLSGGLFVYGLAFFISNDLQHSILVQFVAGLIAILLLIVLNRFVIARYACNVCGRLVFISIHCDKESTLVSGTRFIGLWRGAFIIILSIAFLFYFVL